MLRATRALVTLFCWSALCGAGAPGASALDFVLEIRQPTGENLFSRFIYPCLACTPAQHVAVVPPPGFESAPPRLFLPSSSIAIPIAPPPGVLPALDLVPEIPGAEYRLVAKLVDGQILGFNPTFGPLALARVQRDTRFLYEPGEVVHEVTDPDGNRYVLFTFDLVLSLGIDLTQPGALEGLPLPAGWTYSSHVLESDLLLVSNGLARLFVQGAASSFQRIDVIEVGIDVEPKGKKPKPIKLHKSSVKTAILGEEDFDVTTIDVSTLAFGPLEATPDERGSRLEDVDHDGLLDLVSRYRTEETGIQSGDTEACVTGTTLEGVPFEGCDAIETKSKKPKRPKKPRNP